MGETATKIGVSSLMSYCDDLVKVLQNKKDINNLMQCTDSVKLLRSSCDGDFSEVQNSLEVYQKKIDECQQRINDAKSEVVSDAELDSLQKEYKEELNRESSLHEKLRVVSDKINDLEQQRVSIVEREQNLKKADKDEFREQRKLSMYASVTNIIPNMDIGTKISGHIVEREKRTVEMFEFETTDSSSSIEICNSLWKMINS
ncbi:kinetochore protein SPC24 homolog [Papaver somniferum]|uniref:kinetochore protein SPC24 homolog n=1 Tax=Papaver somniferum TaxID=3469 RepID=UPI000E703D05|nr:kinetochore protein SPC24 homolog [Papaver somniferum]